MSLVQQTIAVKVRKVLQNSLNGKRSSSSHDSRLQTGIARLDATKLHEADWCNYHETCCKQLKSRRQKAPTAGQQKTVSLFCRPGSRGNWRLFAAPTKWGLGPLTTPTDGSYPSSQGRVIVTLPMVRPRLVQLLYFDIFRALQGRNHIASTPGGGHRDVLF